MRPVTRSLTLPALCAGAACLLTACGGGGHPAPTTANGVATTTSVSVAAGKSTSSVSGASGVPPLTKREAIAFAQAVNLTAADVPGFKVQPPEHEHQTAAEKRLEHDVLRCAGGLAVNRSSVAELNSKEFELVRGGLHFSVSSGVTVSRTSAVANGELEAFRSTHAQGCVSHSLDLIFKGKAHAGMTVAPFSISSGAPPAPGTTGSFGWRVRTTITAQSIRLPVYFDILGFVYGPTQVSLESYGLGTPFPAAAEERLFSLLLKRAKAHAV